MPYIEIGSGQNVPTFGEQARYPLQSDYWNVPGGGGGGDSQFQAFYRISDTELEITMNSGVLPADDNDVAVMSSFGLLINDTAPDEFHYQIDRVSLPNKIVIGSAPESGSANYIVFAQNF